MANTFLTDDLITLEALDIFQNNLVAAKHTDRKFEALFGHTNGATSKSGASIRVRKPNLYTVRTGATFAAQDVIDTSVTLSIDQQIGVDTFVTSSDMALSLSSFSDQIIKPQMALLANYVDAYVLQQGVQTFNAVGTPGTPNTTLATYLSAGVKLDQGACPRDGQRAMVVGPQGQADIVDALKGLFNSQSKVSDQYSSGEMGKNIAGFNWDMDQNVYVHTVGPLGGTPLVNGAAQTGASLVTDGWTAAAASRLKKNDIFTIAGVFGVNQVNRSTSNGVLQQFRVTADVSSDGAGNATIAIEPSIITSGASQTVTNSPADNAAMTILGAANTTTAQALGWHKSAIALAFCPLPKPDGVDMASVKTDKQLGISMRFVRYFDGDNDRFKARFDVLFGVKVLRPEWIVRVEGAAA